MIALNRDFGEAALQGVLTISSEGLDKVNDVLADSGEEFGQVVRVLSPQTLKGLPIHPAAKIIPRPQSDKDRMRTSLDKDKQQQPITLYGKDFELIDGVNRRDAAVELGIPLSAIWIDEEALNGLTPEEWVFRRSRANQGDRRLNDTQLALIAARADSETARREARERKMNGTVVGEQKGDAYKHLAYKYGLTPNRCRQAMKVHDAGHQHLEDVVYEGQLSVSKAAQIVDEIPDMTAGERAAAIEAAIEAALAKRAAGSPEVAAWPEALKVLKRSHRTLQKPAANLACIASQCKKIAAEHLADVEQAAQTLAAAVACLAEIIQSDQEHK